MRILLAGPKVCSPWTEGRKRFVRDLAESFAADHEVRVVTTTAPGECSNFAVPAISAVADGGARHLLSFHRLLGRTLDAWHPDLVVHLPTTSFHGRYRIGNTASMWLADRQCAQRGVACLTLMYAITREASVRALRPWVRHLLTNPYVHGGHPVRFGVALPQSEVPPAGPPRELLFMAGMAEPTRERLRHVLEVRGLGVLLRAGAPLAEAGFRLTIAVPLLRDPLLRRLLMEWPGNAWPAAALRILGEARVPDVFIGMGCFVFPYGRDETQFVPTSVIEAMHAGVPVVLPRHPFLAPLWEDGWAAAFTPGDRDDLVRVLLAMTERAGERERQRQAAAAFVRQRMSIDGSCEDILALIRSLRG